ncbi:uncharacterized protein LOC118755219 [Rhagoletis pomonella]|uniref:uncharacterized protein LOC118755219 n=1 Tax=Rhagoletis pomonella TaxID=28610 RepID=UPI00177D82B0|nr:uncharacterized protein LOC118755219 [Rhagoletis pomonella]
MHLSPIIIKKITRKSATQPPYPHGHIVKGVFTGISVEVYDSDSIRRIYEKGCYGKGNKSRGASSVVTKNAAHDTECLTLELEESCFLSYFLGVLCIHNRAFCHTFWESYAYTSKDNKSEFLESLAAYMYLKAKGCLIKSGIKFGGDFCKYLIHM